MDDLHFLIAVVFDQNKVNPEQDYAVREERSSSYALERPELQKSLALQLFFCFEVRALSGSLVSSTPE
jgi:hypothetical protein